MAQTSAALQKPCTQIREILLGWYERYGRSDLPWRQTKDPYRIWVSEIILQQTRVKQGMDYYLRFVERFPGVKALAEATEDEVLRLWQGLGYYSRARNLHAAAKTVAERGSFPTTYGEVRALRGVGDYTAAAICSFAYGLPHAVVDGNVYRVIARYFGIDCPIDTTTGKKLFAEIAHQLLDESRPADCNSAIMDFGALVCKPSAPDCEQCPLCDTCMAGTPHRAALFPVKSKRAAVTKRYLVYFLLHNHQQLLLRRRNGADIWRGLYEPPAAEYDHPPTETEILDSLHAMVPPSHTLLTDTPLRMQHDLTHRRLILAFYEARCTLLPSLPDFVSADICDLNGYALPKPIWQAVRKFGFLP